MNKNSNQHVIVFVSILVIAAAITLILLTSSAKQNESSDAWRNDAPTKGEQSAQVKMVVFTDFACTACSEVRSILNSLAVKYPKDLQYQIRFFPTSNYANSYYAAVAAKIANDHGQFWNMSDLLLENQDNWRTSNNYETIFANFAVLVGIDKNQFIKEFDQQKSACDAVDTDVTEGNAYSITETPKIFLNDVQYGGELTENDLTNAIKSLTK